MKRSQIKDYVLLFYLYESAPFEEIEWKGDETLTKTKKKW